MTPGEQIDIAVLVIYSILFLLSIYVGFLHGFGRQAGWYFLIIFCALRIAGGAVGIVSAKNPGNITDAAWAAILRVIGIGPLLLSLQALLKRVYEYEGNSQLRARALRFLGIPNLVAFILGIVGGVKLESPGEYDEGKTILKASIVLFWVVYVGLLILAIAALQYLRRLNSSESRILFAVILSLPFLAVRLLYSLLADFTSSHKFNVIRGDVYIQLGMLVIMEIFVVIILLVAGVTADKVQPKTTTEEKGMGHGTRK